MDHPRVKKCILPYLAVHHVLAAKPLGISFAVFAVLWVGVVFRRTCCKKSPSIIIQGGVAFQRTAVLMFTTRFFYGA